MKNLYYLILKVFFLVVSSWGLNNAFGQSVTVPTQRYDNTRLGWNNKELILNTNNVNSNTFGLVFSRPVDDQIYAQPLIVSNLLINGFPHNVVYVATVNNTVYAFDADDPTQNTPLWSINLTPSGSRPVKSSDFNGAPLCPTGYFDFSGNIGIVGTPVIDTLSFTIYLVSRDFNSNTNQFEQFLHAMDIRTGSEKTGSPVSISATYKGSGDGNSNNVIPFNPYNQNQRAALLLYNGVVYITWGSHCDMDPYHGWVMGYDATTLQRKFVYNTTPDGGEGGIWMSGTGPSVDSNGYIYLTTGNGSVGTNGVVNGSRNLAESVLKLRPSGDTMIVADYFIPNNYSTLITADLDYGVDGIVILPNTNISLSGSKEGKLYVLNTNHLGKYSPGNDSVLQYLYVNTQTGTPDVHVHGTPVYYKYTNQVDSEYVYAWAESDTLKQFYFNRATGLFDLSRTIKGSGKLQVGMPGAILSVSSNGTQKGTGIVWASHPQSGDANHAVRPGTLEAFDATDVRKSLWSSDQVPARDAVGQFAKFNTPVVSNGKVYLGTFSNKLNVYGIISNTGNVSNLALNKPVTASSVESGSYPPTNVNDGNTTSRWSSAFSDPQWIDIDLQATYNISQVVLIWETASAKAYSIQVSNDNLNWTTVQNVTNGIGGTETWNLKGVSGRYIRMYGTVRNTAWGYSLYEFEVFGSSSVTNLPPMANPGTNQTITLPMNSVTLDGSASTDPDGTITTYVWSQVSGPNTATITNGNTSKATAGNLVAGTYTFSLTVTDNGGLTSSGTVNVTIAIDLPPVANAGTNQTITLPVNSVTLDGSASTDPDGTITTYAWSQVNGPNTDTITNGNTAKATVSNLVAGTYTFSLTVTDNAGLTASNTVTITVNNIVVANLALNKPATSSSVESSSFPPTFANDGNTGTRWSSAFSDPQWIEIDLQATYNISQVVLIWETASAKAYSIDVSNDNVNWTTVQNVTSGTGGTETWNLTGVSGRYIRMHGTLRNTIWGYSLYEFEVFGSSSVTNLPPVANPGTSQTITLPTNSVILDGSASTDPDGTITAYAWSQVSGPSTATMINGNTSKATAGNLVAGTYTFGLTVTDNGGLTSSGTVNVTVATDLPPIANAGTNQTITLPANSVILDGSASTDPDGTITAYAWSQVNGPNTGTITNGNAVKATVSNLVAGTYTFSLTVTDNTGLTASNTVTITVNNIVVANLALNKPATSSSVESSSFPPTFANDGNTGTRWSSAFSDPQWIEIDLQATYNISQVVLIWETASAKAYSIQVSNDNINWTTVQNVTNGVGGTETWNLTGASGRYIRMYGTLRNTIWGYSLYEFEVFGSALKGTNFFNGDTINTLKTVVYPNPFTNLITISTKTDVFKKAKIFDLEGKLLMEWEILPGETEITKDLSLFSNGIYLLKLEGPGTPETIKIIKQ